MTQAKTEQLRSFVTKVLPSNDLEELVTGSGELESMVEDAATAVPGLPGIDAGTFRRVAEKLARGDDLDPSEEFITEAIIIPDKRPVVDILDGDYRLAHELWMHYETDAAIRQRLRTAIRSIGRVELPDHPSLPYGGTAFVVGPDLMMTNRHVAEIFSSGIGLRGLRFRPGQSAGVDFLRERDRDTSIAVNVRQVLMIHPYWDMAILRVEHLGQDQGSLKLALDPIDDLEGQDIAVIGYPGFDPRNNAEVQKQVFGGVYNVKRLQPGKLRSRRKVKSFQNFVSAATHDSSTLGGNSGSAVISAATGQVVALHFGGLYLDANFAVPASELASDPRVVDTGITFAGTPNPDPGAYADAWREDVFAGEAGTVAVGLGQAAPMGVLASFTIPLTISLSIDSRSKDSH
jgi:endonuclease G, mitochondrial